MEMQSMAGNPNISMYLNNMGDAISKEAGNG